MPETHSKLAAALAKEIMGIPPTAMEADTIARVIDQRLAEVRESYRPEELSLCPYVSHHPQFCTFCYCAAMRQFILLPEDL